MQPYHSDGIDYVFTYTDPNSRDHFIVAEVANAEIVFAFAEIAAALGYAHTGRMSPHESEHARIVKMQRRERPVKAVTLAGVLTCTPRSATAVHFADWMRAVVFPVLDLPEFPENDSHVAKFQLAYINTQLEQLQNRAEAARSVIAAYAPHTDAEAAQEPPSDPQSPERVNALLDVAFGVKRA